VSQARRYIHRITIQRPVDEQDSDGFNSTAWETVVLDDANSTALFGYPAQVLTGPGRERHAADTKLAETAARINFRWFPGLEENMRILWPHDGTFDSDDNFSGKVYDIISIETDATDRREYRIRCKDGLTDGR
jgi:head-tail adaptor